MSKPHANPSNETTIHIYGVHILSRMSLYTSACKQSCIRHINQTLRESWIDRDPAEDSWCGTNSGTTTQEKYRTPLLFQMCPLTQPSWYINVSLLQKKKKKEMFWYLHFAHKANFWLVMNEFLGALNRRFYVIRVGRHCNSHFFILTLLWNVNNYDHNLYR